MHRELIPLYGTLAIHSFGLILVIGLIIGSIFLINDPKRKALISIDTYFNFLSQGAIAALIGARGLFVLAHWRLYWPDNIGQIFAIWSGGISLMGAVLALLLFVPYYLKKNTIPLLAFLDLISVYAPLVQSISRIGCFFAGCCYGKPTNLPIGIIFADTECNTPLHPTQIYSAVLLFIIFLFLYGVAPKYFKTPGQLFCLYLLLMSVERFIIDFWRGDQEFWAFLPFLSIAQGIALVVASISLIGLFFGLLHKKRL